MSLTGKPAIAGGEPAFAETIPFIRPVVEEPEKILAMVSTSLESGMLTDGPLVRSLEERMAEKLEVSNCVAVASCTTGLVLLLQALGPKKSVVLPSFTFSATGHAARWNNMDITFADCDPDSWVMGADDVSGSPDVIVGVHVSGVPCDVSSLESRAAELGSTLIFDAAHGAGSSIDIDGRMKPLGSFGSAEVISLTPTKVLSGPEGGLVTTDDDDLAAAIRRARNYGNPGSYDTLEAGLNGRMSEFHAAVVLAGIDHLDNRVEHRNNLAKIYREGLGGIDGVSFQEVPKGRKSSIKDFTIVIREGFGVGRDQVVDALKAEGIPTRPYYSPPLHRQSAYADIETPELRVTDALAAGVISLPIWSHMEPSMVETIIEAISRIHSHGPAV